MNKGTYANSHKRLIGHVLSHTVSKKNSCQKLQLFHPVRSGKKKPKKNCQNTFRLFSPPHPKKKHERFIQTIFHQLRFFTRHRSSRFLKKTIQGTVAFSMGTRKLFNLYLSLAATPSTSSAVILPLAAMDVLVELFFFDQM